MLSVGIKELFTKMSETTVGWHRKETGNLRYHCNYKVPVILPPLLQRVMSEANQTFNFEVDTKRTKYDSNEQVLSYELSSDPDPWVFRAECVNRANQFSSMNSEKFLVGETSPFQKYSIALEHNQFEPGQHVKRHSCEVALPLSPNSPAFVKMELKHQNLFRLLPGRINLVTEYNCGLLKGKTYQNDRFFIYNSLGYLYLGHNEDSLAVPPKQKANECAQVILGDDLGVNKFVYANARLDFLNIPFVSSKLNARVFSCAELVYYPKEEESGGMKQNDHCCRVSLGFGVNLPINEMVALSLYHNFANFGSRKGDVRRSSFVNFTLQFF